MEDFYYKRKEIFNFNKIGQGDFGIVYEDPYHKQTALKIYRRNPDYFVNSALVHANNAFLIKNNVIVPQGRVFINETLMGYYCERIEGFNFYQMQENEQNVDKKKLKLAVQKGLENIKHISNAGYTMPDLYEENIMYDKRRNRVVFIDVDSWRKFDPTKKRNKRKIKNGLKINMNAYKDSIFLYGGEHESKIR